jgi:hypothetical protein
MLDRRIGTCLYSLPSTERSSCSTQPNQRRKQQAPHREVGMAQRLLAAEARVWVPCDELIDEVNGLGAGRGDQLGQAGGRELREPAAQTQDAYCLEGFARNRV